MAKELAANALDRVRLLAAAGRFTDANDGALLNHCATGPDEAAFTALVERHGAMVYSVCFRILRNPHDAEDACQATFLVLARKASSIRKQPSVASWLHGVARRASLTLLRERGARQRHERKASRSEPQATSEADMLWSEVIVLLDEELERLPEQLRGPIILCYLEGKTRDEAAAALGLRQGRLHGLLQRGRALLHDRLVARGVALGAGFLTVGLSGGVGQSLTPTFAIRIVHGIIANLGGQELVPALASAQSTSLTNEVLQAMFYAKLKTASVWSATCIAVAFALVGTGLLAPGLARDEEKKTDGPAVAASVPQPDPKADPKPAPVEVRKVMSMATDKPNDFRKAVIVVSSEHKSLLSRNLITRDPDDPKTSSSGLRLWTLDGDKSKRTNLGDSTTIGFIPKSTLCFAVDYGSGVTLYDTRTHAKVGRAFPHELREDTEPLPAVSPDGEVLVTRPKLDHVQFWNLKTGKAIAPASAVKDIVFLMVFSADGKWLFSHDESGELNVWDPTTGKRAAGPFRHDSPWYAKFDARNYSPKSQQLVTAEVGSEKDAEWKSEAIVRSSKDWRVVHRVKMDGLIQDVKWLDDTHLLIANMEKPKLDDRGLTSLPERNLLQVTLSGEKAEVQTIHRGIGAPTVAPDGKHYIARSSLWKLGEPKPIWTKPSGHSAQFGEGEWVLMTDKGGAVVYSLADGTELWRQEKVEDVKVQGSDIWVFSQKAVEVWRVSVKTQ